MKRVQSILLLDCDHDPDLRALLSSRGYEVALASSVAEPRLRHQTGCDVAIKPLAQPAPLATEHEGFSAPAGPVETLADCEKRHILATLERCGWNRTHAAAKLAISVRTLRNKLKEYRETAANQKELVQTT